jgi:hypothetical protein
MDVRNCCDRALDVPSVNVYGLQPGQSLRERADWRPEGVEPGEPGYVDPEAPGFADALDRDAMVGLLLQPDLFEPADDEARRALTDLLVLAGHGETPAGSSSADSPVAPAPVTEAEPAAKPRPRRTT